jgi:hypothetical protein
MGVAEITTLRALPARQRRRLGDVGRDPPRLVFVSIFAARSRVTVLGDSHAGLVKVTCRECRAPSLMQHLRYPRNVRRDWDTPPTDVVATA